MNQLCDPATRPFSLQFQTARLNGHGEECLLAIIFVELPSSPLFSVFPNDLVDPVDVLGDAGVDARVLCLGAPDAERHDAELLALGVAIEEGPAAVTLNGKRECSSNFCSPCIFQINNHGSHFQLFFKM